VVKRPAAALELLRAQVAGELRLQNRIDLVQVMHHQDVFGGNRAIRLQLERPIARGMLPVDERRAGAIDGVLEGAGLTRWLNEARPLGLAR
jgi:hypothetical protein